MIKIEGKQRDELILSILKRIESDTQVVGTPERTEVWERGWAETMATFRTFPIVASLIPKFIKVNQPVRWQGDFWQPNAEQNELTHVRLMQHWIGKYMEGCEHIAEFGCGTGYNLVEIAKQLPDIYMTGYDFAQSAVDLVHKAAWGLNLNINAERFDMKKPHGSLLVGSGVFTFGAIEQLAGDFLPFMEWVIKQKPKIVIHIEPVIELLDPANLVDYLAIMFMKKRGYTSGFLPWLNKDSRIEVIDVNRTGFGSLMIEGYNVIQWRPR